VEKWIENGNHLGGRGNGTNPPANGLTMNREQIETGITMVAGDCDVQTSRASGAHEGGKEKNARMPREPENKEGWTKIRANDTRGVELNTPSAKGDHCYDTNKRRPQIKRLEVTVRRDALIPYGPDGERTGKNKGHTRRGNKNQEHNTRTRAARNKETDNK